MPILTAKKLVKLSTPFLVERLEDEDMNLEYEVDEFNVKVEFHVNSSGGSVTNAATGIGKYLVDKLTILVSKEVGPTPEIPTNEQGHRNFTDLQDYFKEKSTDYSPVINRAIKGIFSYFKYTLNQPFLDDATLKSNKYHDTEWYDDIGHDYGAPTLTFSSSFPIGLIRDALEVSSYKNSESESLKNYILSDEDTPLQHQILSDAQTAIVNRNLRRGVFEMAVSCELSVKRAFFYGHSFSADAYNYLEDKGKVKVPVVDFISAVAKEVFGESFRDSHLDEYTNIDHLFRCRNKIAHRGELIYKDDFGTLHTADFDTAKEWYKSVRILLKWLEDKQR